MKLFLAVVLLLISAMAFAQTLVGGPCSYDEYPGTCVVTGKDDDGKAVYTFEGDVEGERVTLAGNKSDEELAQGSQVDCMLMFIREGTCTPCLFSIGSCGKAAWDFYRDRGSMGEKADLVGTESGGGCALVAY